MKKMLLSLSLFVLMLAANAQQFTSTWSFLINDPAYTWFNNVTQANNCTSLEYNPVTDKLLVANRNDRIAILNALTGVQEGTLSTTGLGSETFKFNKIRCTSNGVIYGISLVVGASTTAKIYRWASQTANPTLCCTFTTTERCGDAFGLSGTGTSTILYASGSAMAASPAPANSINIYVFNTANGTDFFLNKTVNLPTASGGQWANRAIDPVTNGLNADLWINGGGFPARRITVNGTTAAVATATTDGVGGGQISNGFGGLRHLTTSNNRKYIAVAGGNNSHAGTKMRMLDVTDEAAMTSFGEDSLTAIEAYVGNGNGTGDVAFKNHNDGTYTVFYLGTNNGIEATRSASLLPVSLSNFKASVSNGLANLQWNTATELNNKGFDIQSSIDGNNFATLGFVNSKANNGNSNAAINYTYTDVRAGLKGKMYYRLKQIDKDGSINYSSTALVQFAAKNNLNIQLLANPIKENINLNIATDVTRKVQFTLVDANGAVALTQIQSITAGENNISLSAASLAKGVYYLQATTADGLLAEKAIKIVKQ